MLNWSGPYFTWYIWTHALEITDICCFLSFVIEFLTNIKAKQLMYKWKKIYFMFEPLPKITRYIIMIKYRQFFVILEYKIQSAKSYNNKKSLVWLINLISLRKSIKMETEKCLVKFVVQKTDNCEVLWDLINLSRIINMKTRKNSHKLRCAKNRQ